LVDLVELVYLSITIFWKEPFSVYSFFSYLHALDYPE